MLSEWVSFERAFILILLISNSLSWNDGLLLVYDCICCCISSPATFKQVFNALKPQSECYWADNSYLERVNKLTTLFAND